MIANFFDFNQFSAKKLAVFSKTNVMITFWHKLVEVCAKNANFFAKVFGKTFFNHNIGPRSQSYDRCMYNAGVVVG
jgi:hypothetical protein